MIFQVSSSIEKISTRVDNTLSIHLGTQELSPEQSSELFRLKGKQGWFLFKENEFVETDIPKETAPEFKNEKSPSQRLKACLYVWWEQNTNQSKSFNDVWKEWCNKKCEEIKDTLK